MILYCYPTDDGAKYAGTLSDAKREMFANHRWYRDYGTRISQVNVRTDKKHILNILNEFGGFQTVEREWKVGPRGGLVEVPVGE